MAFPWPDILVPRNMSPPELRNAAKGGGQGFEGGEQRVFSPGSAYWEIRYEGVVVKNRAQNLAWRSTIARLRAGEQVIAKVFDLWRATGAMGPEGAVTAVGAYSAGVVEMTVAANVVVPEAGTFFAINDRPYELTAVSVDEPSLSLVDIILSEESEWSDSAEWVEDGTGGPVYSLRFLPPLRQSVADGAALNFNDITCLCVIDDLASGDLSLDLGKFGTPSLVLREA